MEINIGNVVENYRERIQRLALFDPLYALSRKGMKDDKGKEVDYFSFGLLTLLFFFENMLIRNKKTGVKELALFLQELSKDEITMNIVGYERVARTIIDTFRPPTGKRNSKSFFNWETKQQETVQYSILKAAKADLETNTQYYTLDEQGLELIFATKEYFNEFQLSINQLVLRKQLEKGEFSGALRQIDEMNLDVKNLQDRIVRIKHEVNRSIVSNETYERYKNIIEDINNRLQMEDEEFEELKTFVTETREKIAGDLSKDEDRKAYELIIKIDKELGEVHYNHRMLFKDSIILKTSALQAAQESLYYVGIDSFNFNQEITSRVFSSPIPLNETRLLIEPFLYLEKSKVWSPLAVFSQQRIEKTDKSENTQDFLAVTSDEEMKLDIKLQSNNYRLIASIILMAMKADTEITLEAIVEYMRNNYYGEILNHRSFYDFFIILHQKSPVTLEEQQEQEEGLFGQVYKLLASKGKKLYVEELSSVLKVTDRFEIKDMSFRLEEF
ncbi:replicative DNA helicase [Clostridium sp. YIM B02505]|uniref:Replicative DNA helicase n=1 Tax=Clostridium yunnanense TaxID=2800325 RepID=A0ABS1EUY1_9CLOT|nr:replicative DNA helicase [Clostridium yunnanense]MBK1813187.1 replicative DNA helicase [Clostridium yunnanense]